VVFATLVITLLEGWPWLSIEKDTQLDPLNPYSEMFVVVNTGYIPITSLDALCVSSFSGRREKFENMGSRWPGFATYLGHEGRVTIPCFRHISIGSSFAVNPEATLDITIIYAFPYLNFTPLRRSQEFRFKAISSTDGTLHWQYLD
jgi:hypothetical protein